MQYCNNISHVSCCLFQLASNRNARNLISPNNRDPWTATGNNKDPHTRHGSFNSLFTRWMEFIRRRSNLDGSTGAAVSWMHWCRYPTADRPERTRRRHRMQLIPTLSHQLTCRSSFVCASAPGGFHLVSPMFRRRWMSGSLHCRCHSTYSAQYKMKTATTDFDWVYHLEQQHYILNNERQFGKRQLRS